MRLMSFSMTTEQVRRRDKTVTRRLGWWNLKPGERLRAVVKGQGLRKGEHPETLAIIEVVSTRRQPLNTITPADLIREGFRDWSVYDFVQLFLAHAPRGTRRNAVVNRIEFRYVEDAAPTEEPHMTDAEKEAQRTAALERLHAMLRSAAEDMPFSILHGLPNLAARFHAALSERHPWNREGNSYLTAGRTGLPGPAPRRHRRRDAARPGDHAMNPTRIEWTDATWNPVVGCSEISPACDHCYARSFARRLAANPSLSDRDRAAYAAALSADRTRWHTAVLLPHRMLEPLGWKRPRRVFVV
ncbi:MAG TPA: DUF5131 family protein, partial [Phycisphaerae bacterium]|nr:DUF5131 family protein [Phycisphaerae bacterium]